MAEELLEKDKLFDEVKKAMGIMTSYQDTQIRPFFDDVIEFLKSGGARDESILAKTSVGIIARGVSDLWNYGSGGTSLSPYFMQRAIQICSKKVNMPEPGPNPDPEQPDVIPITPDEIDDIFEQDN